MKVKTLILGKLANNVYILEKNNKCLIIDPSCMYEKIKENISGKIVGILITHHHFDHVGAVKELQEKDNGKVYDINNLKEGNTNIEDFNLEVIYTPGHSKDSISFYFLEDNILFSGDFIFLESVGRCDLDGSDEKQMEQSLSKIRNYPKDMKIYPGHGPSTTLEHELKYNMFLNNKKE